MLAARALSGTLRERFPTLAEVADHEGPSWPPNTPVR
jgi:hypothetical protein